MNFRTAAGAASAMLLGLAASAGDVGAQYYPAPQAYPPQAYPPAQAYPRYRASPVMDADDDPFYDPPIVQRRPLPPLDAGGQQETTLPPPGAEALPPPPRYFFRDAQGNFHPIEPEAMPPRPNYAAPQGAPPPLPSTAAAQPGLAAPADANAVRPPMTIGPTLQSDPGATSTLRGDAHFAALPPDVRPETGPAKELPPQFRRTLIDYRTKEPAGTLIVDTQNTHLYLVLGNGKAMRYGIGVGREGFTWAGTEKVSRMAEWPDWHPPEEMIERQPYLPRFMAGGPGNPLGARALYLGNTIYRIHGTNQPSTIGTFVSSGCIRLINEDVMDLYTRVKVGTRVVVLPGKAPPAAAATSVAPPLAAPANGAAVTAAPLPAPSAMAR
jgi:lipoprotein-anchoring transpeptidase ErfK/SrfK